MTPGTRIGGKYRLLRPLGDGAMGVVWAAVNELTDKEVALKLLENKNPELRRRLLREAKACGRLSHRNIVEIYDVGETAEGDPFLVMELLEGETVAARLLRERALPQVLAVRITVAVARALRVAHEAGVIHRDLKPANIFLANEKSDDDSTGGGTIQERWRVKVVDFGVSKLAIENEATATVTGSLLGSPAYMSPEQARGNAIDGRADLWALGVVLFEMLSGVRPFKSRAMTGVIAEILSSPIPRVESAAPGVDRALGDVVARCLTRDVERRVKNAVELLGLLRPFASSREDLQSTWDAAPLVAPPPPRAPSSPHIPAPAAAPPPDDAPSDAYAPTEVYPPHDAFEPRGSLAPSLRNLTESQRPTLEMPGRAAAAPPESLSVPKAPRLPEGVAAPRAAVPASAKEGAQTSTSSTTPVTLPPELRRWKISGKAPLIALALTVVLAVVGAVVFGARSGHDAAEAPSPSIATAATSAAALPLVPESAAPRPESTAVSTAPATPPPASTVPPSSPRPSSTTKKRLPPSAGGRAGLH